ncbi:MAG: TAT-variant-translocated molybdopterin oxidoreductase [Chitinophagaceae bacterium]|nr:TAT-variant-translocated molybdopterin oxidoreductase [Chitinophagaceae bacterium]
MEQKKYWQSYEELKNPKAFQKSAEDEFKEDLPFADIDDKGLQDSKTPRRDFLKYLGFSTAAAMVAASCETPVRKAVPFVNRPENIIPGIPDYYATTYVSGGDAVSIVAKVRDGRPIKIEGNELSSVNKGGTTARVQASVLDLYDTSRLRFPKANNKEVSSFEALDKMVGMELGGTIAILTGTINSPTTRQIMADFLAKYPGSRHVQYDPISYSGQLLANEATYGSKAIPSYQFDKAKVVVSLGADFLGEWLNAVEYQKGYSAGRKLNQANPQMSKHYQFESFLSMTGANADDRFTHRPSEAGAVALGLLNALTGQPVNGVPEKVKKGIAKVAADLNANKGAGLVISGSNNVNIQIIVNAINEAIGANGTTINWGANLLTKQGIDSDMVTLVADMQAGRINSLLIYDANPAYDYHNADAFKQAIKRVKTTVSFSEKMDETTALCKYVIPSHHYLESWGDAEPKVGYISIMQPTISPLFKTRQFQDSLLKWSGNPVTYDNYFREYWMGKLGTADLYNKALQDGVIEPATPVTASVPFNGAGVAAASAAIAAAKKGGKMELVLYTKIGVGDGKQANNPWLQELPDPITKATWDNYAMVSPQYAKQFLDIDLTDDGERDDNEYEANPPKPVVRIKSGNKVLLLPAMIIPGMNPDTVAVAVGYGRGVNNDASEPELDQAKINIGRAGAGVGKNAYPFALYNGTTVEWFASDVTVEPTGDKFDIATTQTHSSYEGRHEVMKEMTFANYKKNPKEILEERAKELAPWGGLDNFAAAGTLYPADMLERPGIKWGMSIDLNSCHGCGACVVACQVENNVAIVGKSEVLRYHDMAWLRIDRYFSGNPNDPESIQTVFQPMLCQHCENAPCENVCPVAATNHSSEGLNQMIYNRCIGTRYCANNCPYKVRRFNWADYQGADSFADNQKGHVSEATLMMNDDLTRMVLNPDVTVRSRGVIEKCTFCVQRLQAGKLQAKKENRVLTDRDAQTACQQACSSEAIVFGNANDAQSIVSRTRTENAGRIFYSLEQIHTLPNVSYLAKIRNTEVLNNEHGDHIRFENTEGSASPGSTNH